MKKRTTLNIKKTISFAYLTNHDYNIFYILANPSSNEARENTHIEANGRSGDLIGSQYKHVLLSTNTYTVNNTSVKQIAIGGVSTAAGILMGALGLPGATAVAIGSLLYTVISALSPYKVVVSQKLYEVFFSYDNVFYTHCYSG